MKKTPKTGEKTSKKAAGTPQASKENQTPSNVKTPVSKKSAKKDSKKDGLVLKHDSQLPDKPVVSSQFLFCERVASPGLVSRVRLPLYRILVNCKRIRKERVGNI